MALPKMYQDQPELAAQIAGDPTFAAIEQEVAHERKVQVVKAWYTYVLTDSIVGQDARPFKITIEQGTDFKCIGMTISMFSFDSTVANATAFPIPNSAGNTLWAGRGLTMRITDTRMGRDLTSGDTPMELFATPGYGLSLIKMFPFHYFFLRNSQVRFDIRNLDNPIRTHQFSIALHGFKYLTPGA